MPHIKSQFSHTTLFHEPWRSLGHRVCYKCNAPIRVGDWNWTSNTSNGSKYGFTKLPVEHPEKYSHADCAKPADYKQWLDPNKQKANPYATPATIPAPEPVKDPIAEPKTSPEPVTEPTPIIDTPSTVYAPPVIVKDSNLIYPVRIPQTRPGYHFQFERLKRLIENCMDCYLGGSPGAGKSYNIHKATTELGRRYAYLALSDAMMPSAIFGYKNASGKFVKTSFYDFYQDVESGTTDDAGNMVDGSTLDIAELDNANTNVFTTLNNALDNGYAQFEGLTPEDAYQRVKRGKKFTAVGNGNTFLRGPDDMFPERKKQDAASIERFVMINWQYDTQLELEIAGGLPEAKHVGRSTDPTNIEPFNPENVVRWAQKLRANCSAGTNGQIKAEPLVISMRAMKKLVAIMAMGFPKLEAVHMCIFKEYDKDRVETLMRANPINF